MDMEMDMDIDIEMDRGIATNMDMTIGHGHGQRNLKSHRQATPWCSRITALQPYINTLGVCMVRKPEYCRGSHIGRGTIVYRWANKYLELPQIPDELTCLHVVPLQLITKEFTCIWDYYRAQVSLHDSRATADYRWIQISVDLYTSAGYRWVHKSLGIIVRL